MKENPERLGESYRFIVKDFVDFFVVKGDFDELTVANFGDDFAGQGPTSRRVVFGEEVDELMRGSDMVVLNESLFLYLNANVRDLFNDEQYVSPVAWIKEKSVLVDIDEGQGQDNRPSLNEENWSLSVHFELPFTLKKELLDSDRVIAIFGSDFEEDASARI